MLDSFSPKKLKKKKKKKKRYNINTFMTEIRSKLSNKFNKSSPSLNLQNYRKLRSICKKVMKTTLYSIQINSFSNSRF